MSRRTVEVEISLSEPHVGHTNTRWAQVEIGGVPVFSELVYDTNAEGERTDEQAALNLLLLFASRLSRVLGDEGE